MKRPRIEEDYKGSMVLGLNDALVGKLAALAGFSVLFQNTHTIVLAIIVTTIAGALSMAAGEYLQKDLEGNVRDSKKSAAYTGAAYLSVSLALVLPFVVFSEYLTALIATLIIAFIIVVSFAYYSAPIRKSFRLSQLPQKLLLSFGVAGLSFMLGLVLKLWFGVAS
jgi:Uncharacterized membrane protein